MIIAIVGPTGSGKSELAEKLASFYDADIINCDAFQAYKELNLGTAKPRKEILNDGRHHLYNAISISEDFNIYVYQKMVRSTLNELQKEHKNIIIVGGSGLYLRAALYDYNFIENKNSKEHDFSSLNNEELYSLLQSLDSEAAKKIHLNNRKRVARAINIFYESMEKKSEIESRQEHKLIYDVKFYALCPDREILYSNISKRVDDFFANGLEKEAHELLQTYGTKNKALQAIGYKEFALNLDSLATKELIKKNSRNYAKRQITFFKHQFKDVTWFSSVSKAYEFIIKK